MRPAAALLLSGCDNGRVRITDILRPADWNQSILNRICIWSFISCTPQDVLTQHNDNARTGAQLYETALTPANVHASGFGLLYDRHVVGTILAQPLYAHGVSTSGGVKNLIIIATAEDVLYAFDADDTAADTTTNVVTASPDSPAGTTVPESTRWIWRTSLGHPHAGDICDETVPHVVGVTSTPVIDRTAGVIYVVARDQTGASGLGHDHLHKVNLATGADIQQVQVSGSASGMSFNDQCQRQRPGLLLQGGVVYLGYGTYTCDAYCPGNQPYRGWVLGFHASDLSSAGAFTASASSSEGGMGIWASGNGLAGASDGSVFFETGNDLPYGTPVTNLGDSFVKLHGDLTLASHYQPANAAALKGGDTDLGSGGPMLLPGGKLVGGGKDGRLFVLSQADLASGPTSFQAFYNTFHYGPGAYAYNSPATYSASCSSMYPPAGVYGVAYEGLPCFIPVSDYANGESFGPNIHAGPVFWKTSGTHGYVYKMPEKDYLKAFDYDIGAGVVSSTPAHVATVRPAHDGMPGGFSSISAHGQTGGIVWTVVQQQNSMMGYPHPAILYAHDALDLHELWNNSADSVTLAKFNAPTIADGKVILPSVGLFQVYGQRTFIKLPNIPIYWPIWRLPPEEMIQRRWSNLGGPVGLLGRAMSDLQKDPDGGVHQEFETQVSGGGYGQISMPPGTRILEPMCDEKTKGLSADLKVQSTLYASRRTGAHFVMGEIRRAFLAEGGAAKFGYPLTDEVPTPDGFGLMTRFEKGAVFWYAGHEAQVGEPRLPPIPPNLGRKPG